jgi:hypothetical protein
MNRDNWPVEKFGIRPAGKPDECFYCRQKSGDQHAPECVIRERTVLVDVIIQMVMTVPEKWTPDTIEFSLNESSSCANNMGFIYLTSQG